MVGILIITGVAFVISIIIVIIDNKLHVGPDYIKDVERALPGYNCGACGYGSCHGMATKINEDISCYHKCRMLKDDSELKKVFEVYGKIEEIK